MCVYLWGRVLVSLFFFFLFRLVVLSHYCLLFLMKTRCRGRLPLYREKSSFVSLGRVFMEDMVEDNIRSETNTQKHSRSVALISCRSFLVVLVRMDVLSIRYSQCMMLKLREEQSEYLCLRVLCVWVAYCAFGGACLMADESRTGFLRFHFLKLVVRMDDYAS